MVRFLIVKSPLCLTENLPGGQVPPMLWRWHVDILVFKKNKKKQQLHGHGSWLVCEVALIRYQKMDMYANLHTPHTCWCKAPVNDSYQHGTLLELV